MALHRSRRPVLLLLGGVGAAAAAAELPPYPTVRYTAWDDLAPPVRAAAAAAGYGEKSWNRPHTLAAEELDYASLEPAMHDLLAAAAVSDASWDCHVNHYRNYEWQELETLDVQKSYKALGWDEDMWCGSEEPDEEGWYWGDLTPAQQDAAAAACYSPQTWDEVSIPLWGEDDQEGGVTGERDAADPYSAQEQQVQEEKQVIYAQLYPDDDRGMEINGPASAHNDRGIPVPLFRYDPWDALAPEVRSAAARAGYKEKDWNAIRTNGLEKMGWETIGDKHPATQKALRQLGFSEAMWDAYMLHYNTYEWGELRDAGVQDYFKALGYSRNDWDQDSLAPACGLYWPDLTDEQREAAYQVGYFRETWDEVSLQFWPRTTSNTASLKQYVQEHQAAVGGGTVGLMLVILASCAWCCCRVAAKRKAPAAPEYEMPGGSRFTDDGFDEDDEDCLPAGGARTGSGRRLA